LTSKLPSMISTIFCILTRLNQGPWARHKPNLWKTLVGPTLAQSRTQTGATNLWMPMHGPNTGPT
jgi:hypothetical protein